MNIIKSHIKVLSEETANRIAAGEVVERPASVLKELLENALDAGATRIDVNIEGAGSRLIRVADNGHGMNRADLELCLMRHATSKIKDACDLERVLSLGFRGEALPSIASVSKFTLRSRPADQTSGFQLKTLGGGKPEISEVGCPAGTVVEVEELFFNVPARRKFLKTPATEAGHLAAGLIRLALSRPAVGFSYRVGGQTLYQVPADAGMNARVGMLLGKEMLPHLVDVDYESGPLKVSGLVSLPSLSRPNADYVYLFINGRFVRDKVLLHAITHAYSELMPSNRKPVVVLDINLDPALVDVNVHPAKTEVRFRDSGSIHQALSRAIRYGLNQWDQKTEAHPARPSATGDPLESLPQIREDAAARPASPGFSGRAGRPYGGFPPYSQSGPAGYTAPPGPSAFTRPLRQSQKIEVPPFKAQPMFQQVEEAQPLAQLHGLYILASDPDGLLIIDQHAAHERLNYEKLKAAFEQGEAPGQALLSPTPLNLNPREMALVENAAHTWQRFGLELVPFGPRTWAVAAVPPHWAGQNIEPLVIDLLAEMELAEPDSPQFVEKSLRTLACHSSVLQGMRMSLAAMQDLLDRLFKLPPPLTCPHGRPVVLRVGAQDLLRAFGRI